VLLKQDKTEAVMAVDGRLEFIDKEMWALNWIWSDTDWRISRKRIEKQIKDVQEKSDQIRSQVSLFISLPWVSADNNSDHPNTVWSPTPGCCCTGRIGSWELNGVVGVQKCIARRDGNEKVYRVAHSLKSIQPSSSLIIARTYHINSWSKLP